MKTVPLRLALMGAALSLLVARSTLGQGFPPPLPPQAQVQPAGRVDVNRLSHQMAEQVRHLGDDIAADLGQAPQGRHLIQDTQELAQALDEFHETVRHNSDPNAARQAYAGLDATWNHLKAQLSRPGNNTPAVDRAARRVEALNAEIRGALGLNAPPPGYYGQNAPTGLAESRRLAHALVSRADLLATTIRRDMIGAPNGAALAADAAELARQADVFHDAIDSSPSIEVAAQRFAPVDAIADRIERVLTADGVPPNVQNAWQGFASVEILIHQNLGLQSPQPTVRIAIAAPPQGPPPIVGLADQLVAETNAFVQVFGPTARQVPDGGVFLIDAERLQTAAVAFRQDCGRNLPPNELAYHFREVDACWNRLARRVNRIARGRVGPNIAQVQKLGAICDQIHTLLGIPGYAPVLSGPAFRR